MDNAEIPKEAMYKVCARYMGRRKVWYWFSLVFHTEFSLEYDFTVDYYIVFWGFRLMISIFSNFPLISVLFYKNPKSWCGRFPIKICEFKCKLHKNTTLLMLSHQKMFSDTT